MADHESSADATGESFSVAKFIADGGVAVPSLCKWHQHDLVVKQLHIAEDAKPSWRVWSIVALLLLFHGTVVDKRFQASTDGSTAALNVFLKDVGCPACANVALYKLVVRVMRKGLDHAVAVSKMETQDPEWEAWIHA